MQKFLLKSFFKSLLLLAMGLGYSLPSYSASFFEATTPTIKSRLTVNDQGEGSLMIVYTGFLFECLKWSDGRIAAQVDVVYIVTKNGVKSSHRFPMYAPCNQIEPVTREAAQHYVLHSQKELWQDLVMSQDLKSDQISLEVAFVSGIQWDSDYGHNYNLVLNRMSN